MNINMKKQINPVSNGSVKSIITVAILSAMLCTFSVKANNKPSLAVNVDVAEMQSENIIENWMNSETYWGANSEMVEVELDNSISQWMVSGSYWGNGTPVYDETENLSAIEPWMNSNHYWGESNTRNRKGKTLHVESWMSSTSYWINGNSAGNQAIERSCKLLQSCASLNYNL